jgi:hypothetical protein
MAKKKKVEFFVDYPWGSNYTEQLEEALQSFGFRTITDPECEGSDCYIFVVAKNKTLFRKIEDIFGEYETAMGETHVCDTCGNGACAPDPWEVKEDELSSLGTGFVYISADWKHLDKEDTKLHARQLKKELGIKMTAKWSKDESECVVTIERA